LGKRLVQKLSETDDVAIFGRRQEETANARFFQGDIRDKVALRKAFSGIDIVYHLAACLDEASPDLWDINVKGTQNVVELCKENKVKQLIYMSSSGVLGQTRVPAKENFSYNPETEYEKSKMEAEKIVKNSGVPYTIVRTSIVIGPNQIWAAIFEAARRRYPIIGSGKNYFHLVYIKDVVDMLVLVKANKKAINEIFHVASKDIPTYEDVYRMISEELGTEMPTKHVPIWLAMLGSSIHMFKCRLTGRKPKLTKMKSSIQRLVRNRIISTEKSQKILGFEPKYSTSQAIKETIKYLQISRLGYSDYDLAEISRIKGVK